MRVAVIGDLAGHLDDLTRELVRLGAAARTFRLPDDLAVIQVGDLVHRGPKSEGVVALVDRYLHEQPDQWTQLAGNHEAQYLRAPSFDWPESIGEDAQDTLRRWWQMGRMRIAASVHTAAGENLLVTHAGLTEGYWREALDSPRDAGLAAAAINSFIGTHEDVLFHSGQMLGGGDANLTAGPVWAAAATEVVPSWLRVPMPFSLVHGHSTLVDWRRRQLRCPPEIAERMTVDEDAAHTIVTLPGGRIVGVDPGHAKRAQRRWRAFVLDEATVARG